MHTSCTHIEHTLLTSCAHLAHILHTPCTQLAHILHTSCTHLVHTSCTHIKHTLHTSCTHIEDTLHTSCTHLGLKSLFSGGEWRRGHNLRSSCIGAMVDSCGHWNFITNSQWRLHQVLCINNVILINTSL